MKNGIKRFRFGFLDKSVEENLKVYRENFDVVLTEKEASFESVKEIYSF